MVSNHSLDQGWVIKWRTVTRYPEINNTEEQAVVSRRHLTLWKEKTIPQILPAYFMTKAAAKLETTANTANTEGENQKQRLPTTTYSLDVSWTSGSTQERKFSGTPSTRSASSFQCTKAPPRPRSATIWRASSLEIRGCSLNSSVLHSLMNSWPISFCYNTIHRRQHFYSLLYTCHLMPSTHSYHVLPSQLFQWPGFTWVMKSVLS